MAICARFTVFYTVDGDDLAGLLYTDEGVDISISSKKLRMWRMHFLTYGNLSLLPVITTSSSGHKSHKFATFRAEIIIPQASRSLSYWRNSCFLRHFSVKTSALCLMISGCRSTLNSLMVPSGLFTLSDVN